MGHVSWQKAFDHQERTPKCLHTKTFCPSPQPRFYPKVVERVYKQAHKESEKKGLRYAFPYDRFLDGWEGKENVFTWVSFDLNCNENVNTWTCFLRPENGQENNGSWQNVFKGHRKESLEYEISTGIKIVCYLYSAKFTLFDKFVTQIKWNNNGNNCKSLLKESHEIIRGSYVQAVNSSLKC